MTIAAQDSPAIIAAREAEAKVASYLNEHKGFVLEAGAGAGKTHSLVEALKHLIAKQGAHLRRHNQRVACITYTNAAIAVINSRIDGNPLVFVDTIHAFCWSLIKAFQPFLRKEVAGLEAWQEKLAEAGGIGMHLVEYDLGHRRINETMVSLHHDDVLALAVKLLPSAKFQSILAGKYPFILIDEYQDTNADIMNAIKQHLVGREGGPLVALFGDHWQKIYDQTCGQVIHDALPPIGKKANFRSSTSIVGMLNRMRPELPQAFKDPAFIGSATVYHTNKWVGDRRTGAGGGHWTGDLPADAARRHLQALVEKLKAEGWDFSPQKTKILMLTHNVLAAEQGYPALARVFSYTDSYIKKEDDHIAFFADTLEPAYDAYRRRRYGEMFQVLGNAAPSLKSHAEKSQWTETMDGLAELRTTATMGQLIDLMRAKPQLRLPDKVLQREDDAKAWAGEAGAEIPDAIRRTRALRDVPYQEMIALDQFIDGHTPFATKHSTKGDEFENVLIVLGRGWNKYNFGQYLAWAGAPDTIPADKRDSFERNRNLFYVTCSRPIARLALLFTQLLSPGAMQTLQTWFGMEHIHEFSP